MIHSLLSGSLESNTYLVCGGQTCVVDPGISPERVLDYGRESNIGIDVLINTHCHFDHVGANPGVLDSGEIRVFCHESDAAALMRGDDSLQLASLFGCEAVMHGVDRRLVDGDIVDLGGVKLMVVHTPGHTPGSICLYEPESMSLFTGDTVFADGVGRTDFRGGSWDDLRDSVERLVRLVGEHGVENIYPGHGPTAKGKDIKKVYEAYF